MCMSVFAWTYICAPSVCLKACGGPKRALDPLKPELQMTVNCIVGCKNALFLL